MPVQPIRDDDPQVSPHLCIEDVSPEERERRAADVSR
jgi:hypothetical protein